MDTGSHNISELSFLSLLGGLADNAKDLLIEELALTKLEAKYEIHKAKTAAITLGMGIGLAAAGGMLLALMLVHMLAVLTMVPLWGCYGIVGIVLFALGGVLLVTGKNKAK